MRAIERAKCSCGGKVFTKEPTDEEVEWSGCSRGCCVVAMECDKCQTRFTCALEAPEME